jgi:Flp pilus assembly protein TadG
MLLRFWKSEDGNYAAIFSIAMLPIMSGVAGLVDYSGTSMGASKLQESLDATALALATKYHSGMTQQEIDDFGAKFFAANIRRTGIDFNTSEQMPTASVFDQVSGFSATAVKENQDVNVTVGATLVHNGFIGGSSTWNANRHSYVKFRPGLPACVLALDDHAADSIKIQGSTQVTLDGCVIATNSDAIDSVYRGGSAQLGAKCVSAVGRTDGLTGANTKLTCGAALEKQYPSLDPLADVVPPPYGTCKSMPGGKTKSLTPGTFCNKSWTGDITLDPGSYILKGGQIKLGGGGHLTGHGVTIFLMEGAEFTISANETVDLSPPTSGTYAGITVYQEKANTTTLSVNGTVDSKLTGFVYAPGAHVFYAGNSNMAGSGDCIRVIGDTIELTGNSKMAASCKDELGGRDMTAGRMILLVQ